MAAGYARDARDGSRPTNVYRTAQPALQCLEQARILAQSLIYRAISKLSCIPISVQVGRAARRSGQ
jgi:hypothetical protein